MRLASDDVRDHMFHTEPTTDHRIGATGLCCGRDVKKSTFAEFLVPFDFRHLQQYLPSADIAQLFDDLVGERQQGRSGQPIRFLFRPRVQHAVRGQRHFSPELHGCVTRAMHDMIPKHKQTSTL
jgi:hypothetical protein